MSKDTDALFVLVDGLTKIANHGVRPVFTIPEFAQQTLGKAQAILKAKREDLALETDSDYTTKEFKIAQELVKRYANTADDIELEEVSRYENENKRTAALYMLTLKDTADTASALDWLDTCCNTYTSEKNGVCLFFEIGITTGAESVYLTEEVKQCTDEKST